MSRIVNTSTIQRGLAFLCLLAVLETQVICAQTPWKDAQSALKSQDYATAARLLQHIVEEDAAKAEGGATPEAVLALAQAYAGLREKERTYFWFKEYLKTGASRYASGETATVLLAMPFFGARDYEAVTTLWKITAKAREAEGNSERVEHAEKGVAINFKCWIGELVSRNKSSEAASIFEQRESDAGAERISTIDSVRAGLTKEVSAALSVGPQINLATEKLARLELFCSRVPCEDKSDQAFLDAKAAFDVAVARSEISSAEKAIERILHTWSKGAVKQSFEKDLMDSRITLGVLKGDADGVIKAVRQYDDWSQAHQKKQDRLSFLLHDATVNCWAAGLFVEAENYFQQFKDAKKEAGNLPADLRINEAMADFLLITRTGDAAKIKPSILRLARVLKDEGAQISQEQIDGFAHAESGDVVAKSDLYLKQQAQVAQLNGQLAKAAAIYRQLIRSCEQKGLGRSDRNCIDYQLSLGLCLSNLGHKDEANKELWDGWLAAKASGISLSNWITPLQTLAEGLLEIDAKRSLEVSSAVNKVIPPNVPGRTISAGMEAVALDRVGRRADALQVASTAIKNAKVSLSSILTIEDEAQKRSYQRMLAQTMTRLFTLKDGTISGDAGLMLKGIILAALDEKILHGQKRNISEAAQAGKSALSLTCSDIQARLPQNVAVVDYIKTPELPGSADSIYGAVLITAKTSQWIELGDSVEIDSKVASVRSEMTSGIIEGTTVAYLRDIYSVLWREIEKNLSSEIDRVVVCPDGPLHNIPFSMLIRDDASFVIQHYELAYASSSRDTMQAANWATIPSNASLLSICPSFPGRLLVPKESRPKQLAGGSVITLDGATEADVRKAQKADILHIATHGEFLDNIKATAELDRPVILLTGGDKTTKEWRTKKEITASANDNVLSATEMLELKLDCRLLFFACCLSGSGDVVDWEGKFGFRRALTLSGAGVAITALWEISSPYSATFVPKFYDTLTKHPDPVQALAITQREQIQQFLQKNPSDGLLMSINYVGPFVAELRGF